MVDINPFVYAGVRSIRMNTCIREATSILQCAPESVAWQGWQFSTHSKIETPAVSYDKSNFRITKGKWEIGS